MPSIINTNLPSLNTQRNLNVSQAALSTSIQRLSSGLRVNSAKDDAAGLAIAERMNAQVKGLNVAARNANDGVSLAQTAEGALGKVGDMVQRIRELAVQSSNATNSKEDRAALQQEVSQLKDEISRLASTTNFNGTRLLDGSFQGANFQVGADAGQTISISDITDAQLSGFSTNYATASILASTISDTPATNLDAVAQAESLEFVVDTDGDGTTETYNIGALGKAATPAERQNQIIDGINKMTAKHGVTAFMEDGKIVLTSDKDFTVNTTATAGVGAVGFATGTAVPASKMDLGQLKIDSYGGAQQAIRQADQALKQIDGARARLGALQSRFENAVSNIQITAENTTAARSRIVDTDFAAETAAMTRAQILQQAGNAMLAQANQLPQQVLSLLKG